MARTPPVSAPTDDGPRARRAPLFAAGAPPQHTAQPQHQEHGDHREYDDIDELKAAAHIFFVSPLIAPVCRGRSVSPIWVSAPTGPSPGIALDEGPRCFYIGNCCAKGKPRGITGPGGGIEWLQFAATSDGAGGDKPGDRPP